MKLTFLLLFVKIVLLFESCGTTPCPPCNCDTPTTPPNDTLTECQKIGICAFTWTPLDKLDTFKQVRVFVTPDFIWSERGLFVEPIKQSRTDDGKGLDTWLRECKRRGILPTLAINQSPSYFGLSHPDMPPTRLGNDRTKPESYKEFAQIFGQLARRYGSIMYHSNTLKVDTLPRWTNDPPNKRLSGLNLPLILEIWNEPDKWWHTSPVYITAPEYGAMLAACYDSVKAADPKILVAMAGLTNFDLKYLNELDAYFKATRGGVWPCDIINVHHYSNRGNELGKHPPTWLPSGGVPVELDKDFARAVEVVKFAKARGKKVWVSEFGYDTRAPSQMHVQATGGMNDEQTQAAYLIGAYEAYLKAGFDGCFAFTMNDELNSASGSLFSSCGLLNNETTGFRPKESYSIVAKWLAEKK